MDDNNYLRAHEGNPLALLSNKRTRDNILIINNSPYDQCQIPLNLQ